MTKLLLVSTGDGIDKKIVAGLKEADFEVKQADVAIFGSIAGSFDPDVVLLYCNKNGWERGFDLLRRVKTQREGLPIVCLTAQADVQGAVEMMKAGAFDYFKTPVELEKIRTTLAHAARMHQLTRKVSVLESQVSREAQFEGLTGVSGPMQEIFQMIRTVAKSHATVLIIGESGTGKELVAKAIHHCSDRAGNRFIDINCGAIPKDLLENELFGHERGSFTGAEKQYQGSCERANGGTLFLDEISEMDPSLQVKLLRVLQERNFNRIGGTEKVEFDIRIIAATNRDIRQEVAKGAFREDLYYRLNVVPIVIPPLRMRREDIPYLARHFLESYARKNRKRFKEISPEAIAVLVNYDWPGNVRELENAIERVVVLHDDLKVRKPHLPRFVQEGGEGQGSAVSSAIDPFEGILSLDLVERYAIESALARCGGDVGEASARLEIGQATLYRKLKKYGLRY